ncbi:MAG TPA: hypothetical protein VJ577_16680 [Burkholderiaceae bacterium]|nr:hypothetical protein [Burkholderiaceae bacterium]
MSERAIIDAIVAAVAELLVKARPYLLAMVLGEPGLSPFLEDLLTTLLADAAPLVDEQHMAFVAAHYYKRAGQFDEAARQWAEIDYAGTADEARAAGAFMAGLPSLIRTAESRNLH